MAAEKTGEHQVTVSFDIENTGKMDASEVAQVYVHDVQSSVPRPLKELKGYEKVFLKKGGEEAGFLLCWMRMHSLFTI